MTFAGYGMQTPNNDLLEYRQIGNVVLTVSKPLPPGSPNNINTHGGSPGLPLRGQGVARW